MRARHLLACAVIVALVLLTSLEVLVSQHRRYPRLVSRGVTLRTTSADIMDNSGTTTTQPAGSPASQTDSALRCSAHLRRNKFLAYAAHSGFGNQELALRRALLVSYVLNRTLVLPPVLRQADLAFGPPEVRCRNASWQALLKARAERIYASKLDAGVHVYESLLRAFDFGELDRVGVHVIDYAALMTHERQQLRVAPLAPLGCAKSDRYTAHGLQEALQPLESAPYVWLGSAYFLRAKLDSLLGADACFESVHRAVLRLPLAPSIQLVRDLALSRLAAPFASVHLRMTDAGAADATSATRQLMREIEWLRARLAARLTPRGCCGLYVATNVLGGTRSTPLAPLCSNGAMARSASTSASSVDVGAFNCSDLNTLGVSSSPQWRSMINVTGLSFGTAAVLLDQAIGASAGRGFYATSKFCGPPGFRRSTFSEGIALRWAQEHGHPPLCAHAIENALPKGMAAHGTFVY